MKETVKGKQGVRYDANKVKSSILECFQEAKKHDIEKLRLVDIRLGMRANGFKEITGETIRKYIMYLTMEGKLQQEKLGSEKLWGKAVEVYVWRLKE